MPDVIANFSGVFVNTVAVVAGSCVGLVFKKSIPEKLTNAVMKVIALCTIAIGITGVMKGENQLVMIVSLVFGTLIGTLIDIDSKITKLGDKIQSKRKKSNGQGFSQGFVTASLLFCVGAMTIVGSMNAGISGDNEMLYTKSVLDLISSAMLSASLGIGVLFSAVFVLIFQGGLVVLSLLLGSFLSDFAVAELVCAGSVMIMALGLNILNVTKIKVSNMLPAIVLVPFVCELAQLIA